MKRINSVTDALNTNKVQVDVGDGIVIPLPTDGVFGGERGPAGVGIPTGGTSGQVVQKTTSGTIWATPSKDLVGLTKVDNTADIEKPLSEPQALALTNKADLIGGKVAASQLPAITPLTDSTIAPLIHGAATASAIDSRVSQQFTDAKIAPLINGATTGAAIDARINQQVAPQVEQLTANYIAGDRAVADSAAAAVNASPKIVQLETQSAQQAGRITSLIAEGVNGSVRNIILNPGPQVSTPAWITSWGTSGAGTRDLIQDAKAPSRVAYLRHTWTTSATSTATLVRTPASQVTAGTVYSGSIWVRSSIANVMGATFSFYAADGTQLGTNVFNRLYKVPANQWTRLDINGYTAPDGVATIRVGAAVNGTGSVYSSGETLDVCAALTVEGSRVFDYFDGSHPNAYWLGGVAESASVGAIKDAEFGAPFAKAPTHAGQRAGKYSRGKRLYLPVGADIGPLRRRIRQALEGQNTLRLAWLGHSIVAGQGGSPGVMDNVRLLQQRAAQSGNAVTGLVTAANNTTTDTRLTFDPEWEMLGGPRSNMQLHRRCMVAGKVFTYTSTTPGNVVDIYTFGNGSPVTYSIDNGAPVTITPSGASAIQVTTVEGLANRTHKVTITSTTDTAAYLLGISVRRMTGFEVSNFGYSGAVAGDWRTDYFSASGRFYNGYNDVFTSWAADAAIIQLGANELIHGSTPEKLEADLSNIVGAARTAGKDLVLVLDTPVEDASRTTWVSDYCPAVYNAADAYRVPLVDLTAHWISRPVAAAQDFYADQWHPNAKGYYNLHEVMANVLLP